MFIAVAVAVAVASTEKWVSAKFNMGTHLFIYLFIFE